MGDVECDEIDLETVPTSWNLSSISVRNVNIRPLDMRQIKTLGLIASNETTLEIDNHADTCVVGKQALIIYDYERPVSVQAYDPSLGTQQYRTVSAVVGYECLRSGKTYLMVLHQAIEIPHLDHHLLCPMQCRMANIKVNETPKFLCQNPDSASHAVVARDPEGSGEDLVFPLTLQGVTSCLPVFKPTMQQWSDDACIRIDLTDQHLDWDPTHLRFRETEDALINSYGELMSRDYASGTSLVISSVCSTVHMADISDPSNLPAMLLSKVRVSAMTGTMGTKQGREVDAPTLAKRWNIPLDKAASTVRRTTQRGVRDVSNPMKRVRYPTNDRMLRYNRLPHDLFSDTMFAGTPSSRKNMCAQVFCTSYGWCRAYPMKSKGEAHKALSKVFKQVGVPTNLITDNAWEVTKQAKFTQKCKDAVCHQRTSEPHSQWQDLAEGCIRELKRKTSRDMIGQGSPKPLWDYCLELQSRIRSHSALTIYDLDGLVPETKLMGSTADISNLCEFGWYQWVLFVDAPIDWPDDRWVLGRYLGPADDVGSMLTSNILKANGQVVCRTSVRHLTPDESKLEGWIKQKSVFDANILVKLGEAAAEASMSKRLSTDASVRRIRTSCL